MTLKHSDGLGRKIRQDKVEELGIPTWDLVRQAIEAGESSKALELLDYGTAIDKWLLDALVSYVDDAITFLADRFGEDVAFEFVRKRYLPRVRMFLEQTPGPLEAMQREVENQRAHYANVSVVEEPDRYVVTCDPAGTCGRLRQTKNVGRTKEPHDWSWQRVDLPYYCAHSSLMWEIIPIEERGYPIAIFLCPERDEDPCVHLYYKDWEKIPEEYYERIGKTKPKAGTIEHG